MNLSRRLVSILTALLLLTMAAPLSSQSPDVPNGAEGQSYYTAFPVTMHIDGDFADWDKIPLQSLTTGPLMPLNAADGGSMRFAVAADMDNLYLRLEVTDAHIIAGKHAEQFWFEDSVEVYINATGTRDLKAYAPGVVQLNFPAANIGRSRPVIGGINSDTIAVQSITIATATGYAIEAAVPLHTLVWNIVPAHDGRLGFQIQLNGASELERNMKLSWSVADVQADVSYQDPSVFGELIFFQNGAIPVAPDPTATPSPEPLATSGDSATPLPTLMAHTGFTVVGSKIFDPYGNEFIARGVNVSGYNWVWERHTASDVDLIVDCWNFNLVRVNSFLFTGQVPYQQYNANNDLDEIVRAFTSRGIVVVFEGHDRIGSYYEGGDLTTLISWFTDLATRYGDNPYVWFDVMNEPGGRRGLDSQQWVNMHGQVIEAIRGTGANNIIMVEGAFGGQDNRYAYPGEVEDSAILDYSDELLSYNGQDFQNIVFSVHTYDLWNQGDEKMATYFAQVKAKGLPLIIGEYAVFTDQDTVPAVTSLFAIAPPAGVGRIVWHWDGGDANDLTNEGGGWMINDCETPTNLSWLGQNVWDDNHR